MISTLTILMLAQLETVDPQWLSNFAIVALVVVGALVGLATAWNTVRLRPPHETPTRREFDALATKVKHIEDLLQPMERRILDAVSRSADKVQQEIRSVAEADHEGQVQIWDQINVERKELGERVAAIEARLQLDARNG